MQAAGSDAPRVMLMDNGVEQAATGQSWQHFSASQASVTQVSDTQVSATQASGSDGSCGDASPRNANGVAP
jgi:thiamine-monophosphate kinase